MKYLTLTLFFIVSFFSTRACDCLDDYSSCDITNFLTWNSNASLLVCYVEYTGNSTPLSLNGPIYYRRYEVKIIDLYYGKIQPGSEGFLNTDSTFWVVSGGDSCNQGFTLEEGDYAIMAPFGYNNWDYSFDLCRNDLSILSSPLNQSEDNDLLTSILNCIDSYCETDLILSSTHFDSHNYQGLTISSSATVEVDQVAYKANDRVTLESGFTVKANYNFSIDVDNMCN